MQYRVLGSSGERVSAAGLGGFPIGKIERRQAIRLIRAAIDGGWQRCKTTDLHDGTDRNPHWLTTSAA